MAVEQGVGYKVVKTLASEPVNKTYLKVKQADDLSVKNYQDVKETDGTDKDYIEVVIVDYDDPKDFLLVNYLDTVTPNTSRQYYALDGADDFIEIPKADLVSGDVVKFKFRAPTETKGSTYSVMLSPETSSGGSAMIHFISGNIALNSCTGKLDGNEIDEGRTTPHPIDGLEHEIELVITRATTDITYIGKYRTGGYFCDFPIWDIDINGQRFYPVDDGNSAIKDTISGQDGTLVNGNELNWLDEL